MQKAAEPLSCSPSTQTRLLHQHECTTPRTPFERKISEVRINLDFLILVAKPNKSKVSLWPMIASG